MMLSSVVLPASAAPEQHDELFSRLNGNLPAPAPIPAARCESLRERSTGSLGEVSSEERGICSLFAWICCCRAIHESSPSRSRSESTLAELTLGGKSENSTCPLYEDCDVHAQAPSLGAPVAVPSPPRSRRIVERPLNECDGMRSATAISTWRSGLCASERVRWPTATPRARFIGRCDARSVSSSVEFDSTPSHSPAGRRPRTRRDRSRQAPRRRIEGPPCAARSARPRAQPPSIHARARQLPVALNPAATRPGSTSPGFGEEIELRKHCVRERVDAFERGRALDVHV